MKKLFYFAAPAVITLAIISCSKEGVKPQQPINQTQSSNELQATTGSHAPSGNQVNAKFSTTQEAFSNEDLFLAIFFLKGAAADEVEALVDLKTQLNNGELNLLSNRGDNVVNFINNSRPAFFDSFGKLIRSRDQQSVLAAIDFAIKTLTELGISNGEGSHVVADLEAGKNCHKWIIITHQLIKRKNSDLSTNTGVINAPEVLLEKEILVNSIVKSFTP